MAGHDGTERVEPFDSSSLVDERDRAAVLKELLAASSVGARSLNERPKDTIQKVFFFH